jgi:SAM-dependent methyltransferase
MTVDKFPTKRERASNANDQAINRLRHPAVLIFLLGGFLGSGLNLGISASCYWILQWNPLVSFFLGTLVNQLFHHIYYRLVYVNQEIRMRTAPAIQLLLYILVAALSTIPLWVLMVVLGFKFLLAVLVTILLLSFLNTLVNRISTFSSARLAEVEYQEMGEGFYDDQTDPAKVGGLRAWYHRSRYERLTRFVGEYYRPGMRIADLGCGSCLWNVHELPVIGVDINEKMLRWALQNSRLRDYRVCADLAATGLPEKAFDIVIMSELLEHLLNLKEVLAEAKRILKDDDVLLITVPYDIFLGPFFIFYNVNCVYQGYVKGSQYHRLRCGHVNHFTRSRLRRVLASGSFELTWMSIVNGLLIYAAARKEELKTECRD